MPQGHDEAFCAFVAARGPALVRSAYLMTGDQMLAEDAVQSALARVYVAWPRISRHEAVEAYTRRALIREVMSWRRRRRPVEVLTPEPGERVVPAVDDVIGDRDELFTALAHLPDRQRAAVVLRYYDDLSESDVAEALGIAIGTVKAHSSRGVAALRASLTATRRETLDEQS